MGPGTPGIDLESKNKIPNFLFFFYNENPVFSPGAPKWTQGPRGSIQNQNKKSILKNGPEVSTIFEILIFGFGVFFMEIKISH